LGEAEQEDDYLVNDVTGELKDTGGASQQEPRLKESTRTNEGAEAPIFYDPNELLDELSEKLGRKMYAAPEAMERDDMQAAAVIANLLTQSQLIPMKGEDAPQGAAYGPNVFVGVETEDPHLYVAMHEIEHTLEDVDPEAHDEFMAIAKKYFNGEKGMSDYYFRHGYSYKDIWKEFTADVTAEIMQQPGFWAKVREQSPALIKKIVDIIDQIITKFRKEVAKDSSMLKYISDIEAFRDEVAGATANLLKKKPRNLLDLRGAEAFAAKMKEGTTSQKGVPFLGIVGEKGYIESYDQDKAQKSDYHHSFALSIKGNEIYEQDSTLRFVRQGNSKTYTLEGGPTLDPFGKGFAQIKQFAAHVIKEGAPLDSPVSVGQQHLGTEFEGKSIGTLADFVAESLKPKARLLSGIGDKSSAPKIKSGIAPIFYSQLERTIQAKMPNAASQDQVLAIIKGGQVKAEEIAWSGIRNGLGNKDPRCQKMMS
jgi:hypothetical protein